MSNTHKRYRMNQEQIQDLLNREFKSSAKIDTMMPNGDVLINQGGSFRKMKAADISRLTQRYVHVGQDNADGNVAQTRSAIASSELTKEAYDAKVAGGSGAHVSGNNPFLGKTEAAKVGGQNTFGSPDVVLSNKHSGLPSSSEYHQTGLPSGTREGREAVKPSGLPSDRR